MPQSLHRLITPDMLHQEFPISSAVETAVQKNKYTIGKILRGEDQRLLVIVGPCSIHDPAAALEYAELLLKASREFERELFIVMRTYFEKPRTTFGWKGFISDPHLNDSFDVNTGLRLARKLLLELNTLGIPAATEFLHLFIPPYLSDLISWTAIGARTSSSQTHRELASNLSMPVGFKNSIDGNIQIAIDAITVAARPQPMLGIDHDGSPVMIHTPGNPLGHLILRGGDAGPNYENHQIQNAQKLLQQANVLPSLLIDCSHGNSMKNYLQQKNVIHAIHESLAHCDVIKGVMIESHLEAGKQVLSNSLLYGQSITDGCLSWQETLPLLQKLAEANRQKYSAIHFKKNLSEIPA